MKRKFIIILLVFAGLITIFSGIVIPHIPNNVNNNENIAVGISEISIKNNIEEYPSYEEYFYEYSWSNELKKEVEKNKASYSMISISYVVRNLSENTTMNDVCFYPEFTEEIKDMVSAYNSDNGTYKITAHPNLKTGMTQNILIKSDEKTNDDILKILNEEVVDMVYYTSHLSSNGKQEYSFKINDALMAYKDNPQLFN